MDTRLHLSASLRRIEAEYAGLPLMQRAGQAAADLAGRLVSANRPILVLAGPGNNGGDAFEAARLLRERFFDVQLAFAGDPAQLPADAAAARQRFLAGGGESLATIDEQQRWGLIVDGLFGIGLKRAPSGIYADWIELANRLSRRDG